MSERAAAAAARAVRALSTEDGGDFDGVAVQQAEIVQDAQPTPPAGQVIGPADRRRTSAAIGLAGKPPAKAVTTCIAGCY